MIIREVKLTKANLRKLDYLDSCTFPTDELYKKVGADWWLAEDDGATVGFAGLEPLNSITGFLCRAGVFQRCSGYGIHRKLIQVREKKARKLGYQFVVTHVSPTNYKSLNNFICCGYRIIKPFSGFWFEGALHLRKEL